MAQLESTLNGSITRYTQKIAQNYKHLLDEGHMNRTGNLRNSITPYITRDGNTLTGSITLMDYWKYLEDGTRYIAPRHLLARSQEMEDKLLEDITEEMAIALEEQIINLK